MRLRQSIPFRDLSRLGSQAVDKAQLGSSLGRRN
jgi:hypothetical protein